LLSPGEYSAVRAIPPQLVEDVLYDLGRHVARPRISEREPSQRCGELVDHPFERSGIAVRDQTDPGVEPGIDLIPVRRPDSG
jgi:hypothetical protein